MMQDRTCANPTASADCDGNVARGCHNDRPIVLIGMMGAGKSLVGAALADALALPFADNDIAIETETGLRIAAIFDDRGEAAFRAMEKDMLRRLLQGPRRVIAAGGGVILDADNRAMLKEKAFTIWLQADIATLARRTAVNADRPLLQGGNAADILRAIADQRQDLYAEAADLRIDNDSATVSETVDAILRAMDTAS